MGLRGVRRAVAQAKGAIIDIEHIVAKLKTLEAMHGCPACGNVGWQPQPEPMVLLPERILTQGAPTDLTNAVPCVVLVCKHCAYIALHATQLLEER